ncbi:Cyclochlorotine biosynthesis protein O [Colletotrichum trifolii]|uniref:Cyclochlorotine biosynthesis protein O n=1 Tax=Colletotrichum trifolii TaxID=5466 RepID=A0A4V3HXV6_COLTR|nr:Cyclochlorotine biosynthesis protein O [Colletotrichum trifolii]
MDRQNLLSSSSDGSEDGDYAKASFLRDREQHLGKRRYIPWLLHVVAFLGYGILFFLTLGSGARSPTSTPKEWPDIYDDFSNREYVWKTHHYKFEGDHTTKIGDKGWEDTVDFTEYEGRPTDKSNQAWADLVQLGSTSITEQERSRLPFETAPNVLKNGEYVIGLQVFHQLHCLMSLREQVWHPTPFKWENGEERTWWELHLDHCLEALRESIVCNADMTPLRYMWDEEESLYMLTLPQQYKCKNWDDNLLRKALYFNIDYYKSTPNVWEFQDDDQVIKTHVGHCLDSLRLQLTCTPSLDVLPWVWVGSRAWIKEQESEPSIIANFKTLHKCRDFGAIKDWYLGQQDEQLKSGKLGPWRPRSDDVIHDGKVFP